MTKYVCQPCKEGRHLRCAAPGKCQCTEPVDVSVPRAPTYAVGDIVEVVGGPFAGYWATPGAYGPVVEVCAACPDDDRRAREGDGFIYRVDVGRPEAGSGRQTLGFGAHQIKASTGDRARQD